MSQLLFALALSAGVAVSLLAPEYLLPIKVDASRALGTACFFIGLGSSVSRFRDLIGTSLGLGNISFSFFIGTFLWPALGLAATVLALQAGVPMAVAVGFVLLAACPVGGPSNAINVETAGGSLECSLLMCFLSTPAAIITFPYIYRHFVLMLLDQPSTPGLSAHAAAAELNLRSQLSQGLPANALTTILSHALFAACLPLAAGVTLGSVLPPKLIDGARRWGSTTAAAMTLLTVLTKTAAGAVALRAAGAPMVAGVILLHVVALVLGYAIPAGGSAPGITCRTTAYQASLRNPVLGLGLAASLFGGSEHFALVAAPCVASILVQNLLGAWTALVGLRWPPRTPVSDSGQPVSPQAFRANSMESILRQQTFRRNSDRSSSNHIKDD